MSYDIDRKLIYQDIFPGLTERERAAFGLSAEEAEGMIPPRTIRIWWESTGDFLITVDGSELPSIIHLTPDMLAAIARNEEIKEK